MSRNKFVPLSMTWRENGEWKSIGAKAEGSVQPPMKYDRYEEIADRVDDEDAVDGAPKFHAYERGRTYFLSERVADELRANTFTFYGASDNGHRPIETSFGKRIEVVDDPPPTEVVNVSVIPRTSLEVRLTAELDQVRAENEAMVARLEALGAKGDTDAKAAADV